MNSEETWWELVLANSALLLGIAVSVAALVTVIQTHNARQRERHALVRRLEVEYSQVVSLAGSLALRAEQIWSRYPKSEGEAWPPPSEEEDSLPEEIQQDVAWLEARTQQVLAYTVPADHLSPLLRTAQLDALARFIRAHRVYVDVVGTRLADLVAFPRRKGVLHRFVGVTVIHAKTLRDELTQLSLTLGLPPSD